MQVITMSCQKIQNKSMGNFLNVFLLLATAVLFLAACASEPIPASWEVAEQQAAGASQFAEQGSAVEASGKNPIAQVTAADSDGDGVADADDQCKQTPPNALVNLRGCALDTDGDQVADYKDQCRGTPRGVKVDGRGCGFDDDADGVPNYKDACPGSSRDINIDGNGCEWDSDNDGVADSRDLCAGTPPGVKVEPMGCHVVEIVTLQGMLFKTGSHELGRKARNVLSSMAVTLKKHPRMRVEIAGHTDNIGSHEINQNLSAQRASSARRFLLDLGVKHAVLRVKAYADSQPIASNDNEEGRQRNRRVELRIVEVD